MKNKPVFDIGDTLIPSKENENRVIREKLKTTGIDNPPEFPINKYNIYKTSEVKEWLDKHNFDINPSSITKAYLKWKDEYFQNSNILETLRKVQKDLGPIGFISDNSSQAKKYYKEVFNNYNIKYNTFVVSEEVRATKPRKKIFKEYLDRINADKPEKYTYYGNYVKRDKGAKKVGMNFVWVKQFHTFNSEQYRPNVQTLTYQNIKETL